MHWRRKWQLTPGFLPGESQGRGSLASCRLWSRTELATTEVTWRQQQRGIWCNREQGSFKGLQGLVPQQRHLSWTLQGGCEVSIRIRDRSSGRWGLFGNWGRDMAIPAMLALGPQLTGELCMPVPRQPDHYDALWSCLPAWLCASLWPQVGVVRLLFPSCIFFSHLPLLTHVGFLPSSLPFKTSICSSLS